MSADRCPTCDRPKCPNFPTADYHTDDARTVCPGCIATDDCRVHAVDWRTRCLAAEAAQAEVEARLAAVVGAVEVALTKADRLVGHLHGACDTDNMRRAGDICVALRAALPPATSGGEKP